MLSFDKGTKVKQGVISIINLHGTWREMGRQYGFLMSEELADLYNRGIIGHLVEEQEEPIEKLIDRSEKFFANFPFRLKEVLRGISETSGLDMEQVLLVNAIEILASSALNSPLCTGIAAWGDYISDSLVYGRNYDYLPWFKEFKDNLVIAVYHPADGSLAVATMGYAGEVYLVNGMNESGIFMELNNGMPSGGALWYDSRVPSVAKLFEFMLDGSSLAEIESFFQTTKSNFAYIVGVADEQIARCYEWPVFEVKRRESHSREGLTVLTNHFTEPSWGLPRPDDKTYWKTRSRRQNLLSLAKHLKGTLNSDNMRKILDTRIEDLGATTDMTVYQIVAVPEKFKIWFKIPGAQDWTEIDMRALLKPREM
ncbi:MAG: hypothetical protein GXZ13_03925 [Synergistaceae bacterium]|jgi:hypothetical protein|nr:hypothetical protein [Synergistaceae bacterium]